MNDLADSASTPRPSGRRSRRVAALGLFVMACVALGADLASAQPARRGGLADKPLFRDPEFDGAADPTIIYNFAERKWWMFYTNRRAKLPEDQIDGVNWVHGTKIGIAESSDGAHWEYVGTANIDFGGEDATYWAPEVIFGNGQYHMYLTLVPGVFRDWGHPRSIVHLTSRNLRDWKYESTLELASPKVIDASVLRLPDGKYRMWYNNEADKKSIYCADSDDLAAWHDKGKVLLPDLRGGEGPKVFVWQGKYWMIIDEWGGLAVDRSDDATEWTRQSERLLQQPGAGVDDGVIGQHADVVAIDDRAYLFYFTHPGRTGAEGAATSGYELRRSSIQVAELTYVDGALGCDRDAPTYVSLRFRRPARIHDPSTILHRAGRYWCFSTGTGIQVQSSTNLREWRLEPPLFAKLPEWFREAVPEHRDHLWAPDLIERDGKYFVYYSVSTFGKQTSAIGLASSPTLDPQAADFGWTDEGLVVRTDDSGKYDHNAIDPSVLAAPDGTLWLAYGSYWTGIKLVELDPATGKRKDPDGPIYALASKSEIEAATLWHHDGCYYLFVNWGHCCRGVNSTYEIRVGRSREVTGPYVDKRGVDLREGGGAPVLATRGKAIGPGHAGIFAHEGRQMLSYHYYAGDRQGLPQLGVNRLSWDADGWPQVGDEMELSGAVVEAD